MAHPVCLFFNYEDIQDSGKLSILRADYHEQALNMLKHMGIINKN